nr:MAG TPA: hypothetical protein [Caudoviricetes sp.]
MPSKSPKYAQKPPKIRHFQAISAPPQKPLKIWGILGDCYFEPF